MIYAAAVLLVIYLSIRLAPYFVATLMGIFVLNKIANEEIAREKAGGREPDVGSKILSSYSSYEEFKQKFHGYHQLSERSKRKVKRLYE